MTGRCTALRCTTALLTACALLPSAERVAAAEREGARPSNEAAGEAGLNLLLLEPVLDNARLADVITAYESGDDILLPVGELARLLTIAVTVDPATQTASGFLIKDEQRFRIDPSSATVVLPSGRETYDRNQVQWIEGDLYVASRLLQRWWPVDFAVDMASLRLNLVAREKLPLQARIEREERAKKLARRSGSSGSELGYPDLRSGYDLLSLPLLDSTLAVDIRGSGSDVAVNASYTGFLTGDLLGMEAAAFVTLEKQRQDARITLARHDPEAGLLGPLNARSVVLGSIGLPPVENVLRGTGVGNGVLVSNRPMGQPASFRTETLRGELPPGWDVTLYVNDALLGFQQARSDGLYEFLDQPLTYGRNEFRLVFNGPFGQTRVERKVIQLDAMLIAPGEFYYTAAAQRDDAGVTRQSLQVDLGVHKDVGLTVGGIYNDGGAGNLGSAYANAGARIAAPGAFITLDYVQEIDGGNLIDFGVHTSVAGMSMKASRVWMNDYQSEVFSRRSDPIEVRDRLRLAGTLALTDTWRLPVAVDFEREKRASGQEALKVRQRVSANALGTSFTNMLEWRSENGTSDLGGVLQMSRRVAGFGLSGQAAYSFLPQAKLDSLAVNVDRSIGASGRASLGVLHDLNMGRTSLTGGYNRNLGSFGIGVSGMFGGLSNYGVGLQVFTAIGRNPHSGQIMSDWRPMAGTGIVTAQVFIDDNLNGVFDEGEDPIEGAAFRINDGSRHAARTDAEGVAVLSRLLPRDYVDIGLDTTTLEDAQLQPAVAGVRVLPRPGRVAKVDFPVVLTGEIDGTVYLIENGASRGIGDAVVELLDASGEVISSTRSASDGFYVLSGVKPGPHRVRISPVQVEELDLTAEGGISVTMPADPDFISGIDLHLRRLENPEQS